MNFREIELSIKYKTEQRNKILFNFYEPVLSRSKIYYRSVGYFTSSILLDYIKSLEKFIENNGRIKLLISPVISKDDLNAIEKALANDEDTIKYLDQLIFNINTFDKEVKNASDLFAALIYKGILEVRIAIPKNSNGIFHEKIGVFEDFNSNRIAIIGSNNETHNAINENYESFNVFCDWKAGQKIFVDTHFNDFNSCWERFNTNLLIFDLTEDIVKKLKPIELKEANIREIYKELNEVSQKFYVSEEVKVNYIGFNPYKHQKDAVKLLHEKHKGILKFATGSGKTKTAILFLNEHFKENKSNFVVVVVPDKTLVRQWENELKNYFSKVEGCDSDHNNWRKKAKQYVSFYNTIGIDDNFILVSTINTFSSNDFQEIIRNLNNKYVFIADECHTYGTVNSLRVLPQTEYRIGLSATPEIHMNDDATSRLFEYFGGILLEYSLADAIRENKLVKYNYYPIILTLNIDEKLRYEDLTMKIVKLLGKDNESEFNNKISPQASMLLFKRSRIIYSAISKLDYIRDNIDEISKKKHMLIYCGITSANESEIGKNQISSVNEILKENNIVSAQYTESESGETRIDNIELFKDGTYKILVAMKCLDQGVDIPEIENAIIMASSTNPREFIQRRGRLLRKNGESKKIARIYDLVILEDHPTFKSLNRNELIRVNEFAELAENKTEILRSFSKYFDKYLEKEKV